MAQFQFSTYRSEIKETAKAYGFRYYCRNAQHAGRWDEAYQWLPKRFTTIEDVVLVDDALGVLEELLHAQVLQAVANEPTFQMGGDCQCKF